MKFTRYISFIFKDITINFKYYFISVLSLAVAMLVVIAGLGTYFTSFYETDVLKDFFRDDDIYRVEYPYVSTDEGYACDLREFYEMSQDEGLVMFSYTSMVFEEKNTNEHSGNAYSDVLMGNGVLDDSDVKDINGNNIILKENDDYSEAAVGYNLKDEMPVGTVLTDRESGKKYKVAYIMQPESCWVSDSFLGDGENIIRNIDDYIYIPDDDYYTTGGYSIAMYSLQNSAFIYDDGNIDEKIRILQDNAKSCNIEIKVSSLKDYIRDYKKNNVRLYTLTVILCVLFGIISAVIAIMTSVIDVMDDKHSIGVNMSNGFLSRDMRNIILIKNLSRLIFPLIISLCVIFGGEKDAAYLYSGTRIFIIIFIWFLLCEILATVITYKMITKESILNLIRGE